MEPNDILATEITGDDVAQAADIAQDMIERSEAKETLLDVRDLSVTLFTEDGELPVIDHLSFVMRAGRRWPSWASRAAASP